MSHQSKSLLVYICKDCVHIIAASSLYTSISLQGLTAPYTQQRPSHMRSSLAAGCSRVFVQGGSGLRSVYKDGLGSISLFGGLVCSLYLFRGRSALHCTWGKLSPSPQAALYQNCRGQQFTLQHCTFLQTFVYGDYVQCVFFRVLPQKPLQNCTMIPGLKCMQERAQQPVEITLHGQIGRSLSHRVHGREEFWEKGKNVLCVCSMYQCVCFMCVCMSLFCMCVFTCVCVFALYDVFCVYF